MNGGDAGGASQAEAGVKGLKGVGEKSAKRLTQRWAPPARPDMSVRAYERARRARHLEGVGWGLEGLASGASRRWHECARGISHL